MDDHETYAIVAAALAVFRRMGGGLLESPYRRALAIEFDARSIPHVREPAIELAYQGITIGCYRPDFVCYDTIIVEVKAAETLIPQHYAQAMHYLMAQGATRALLINFGLTRLRWKRFSRPPPPDEPIQQGRTSLLAALRRAIAALLVHRPHFRA